MEITNKFGLPEVLVSAIKNDSYKGPQNELNRISVSTIKDSPRIHFLKVAHWDELKEDVSDGLWKMLGTAIHTMLERADTSHSIKEQRIDIELDGITISGQMDVRKDESITDYKSTSAWTIVYNPGGKIEWIHQLNLYAWLVYKKLGIKIKELSVNALLRDHTGSKVTEGGKYPKTPFVTVKIPIWTVEETEQYLKGRIALFKSCVGLPDDKLPLCTDEEKWMRKGVANRCEKHCIVKDFCNTYKGEMKNGH
jgi:hypothetical protein